MSKKDNKIIFVIGGVMSGIGKGIIVASVATILKSSGLKVNTIKMDPYLNIDAGTMNPFEHGETFVTSDGLEADLDLGHYERFTNKKTNKNSIITSGKIYQHIINKERKGEYLGHTVQLIPHFTNEIIDFVYKDSDDYDITICEIGGTVGDIESMAHMEAIRQMKGTTCNTNVLIIFLTYIPFLEITEEFKTKPAQDSVKNLLHTGLTPDIILCRYEKMIEKPEFINKISLFSNVPKNRIFLAPNVDNIYKLPYIYAEQNIHKEILDILKIKSKKENMDNINKVYKTLNNLQETININLIIKYGYADAYISLGEALKHAAYHLGNNIKFNWIDIRKMEKNDLIKKLEKDNYAILVPGGFGESGIENKITALNYARTNNIPTLGICYGMQLMAIEFARNVLGISNANTQEIDPSNKSTHIVHIINKDEKNLGGTMRLGDYEGVIKPNTIAEKIYGSKFIERHRHRYEINTDFRKDFEEKGFNFSGTSGNDVYMEISEIKDLDFFVGVQYHPEFNSSIFEPNPVILEFIKHAYAYEFEHSGKKMSRSTKGINNKKKSKKSKSRKTKFLDLQI
jgi:CTP synthase